MKKLSPLALIKKYQFLIIGLAILSGIVAAVFFSHQQTYTATAILEYTNETAEEGLAPDGTEIDTSEIYSTEVMKTVFERMNLSYDNYNLDEFRSKVVVTPILTSEEEAVQDAKNENGEEVETKPTRYQISLTLGKNDASNPRVFARQILDNMLDVFLEKYGELHVNKTTFVNQVTDLNMSDYDYLETIELIESSVETVTQTLSGYIQSGVNFTSAENGYSFSDLYQELGLLQSDSIPDVYAYILNNRISKDTDVLISKYKNRIEDYGITDESAQKQINDIKEIIDAYVSMMRESGNTDITYEYILDQVYDDYYYAQRSETGDGDDEESIPWSSIDETVEYDVLLENYVKNRAAYEYDLIEIAYCEYIIELYSGEQGKSTLLDDVSSPAVYQDDASDSEREQNVETMLDDIVNEVDVLYDRLMVISREFNEYGGAMNISLKSDIVVTPNIQILLYSLIVVVLIAILATIAVIVLARINDIFNFYFYMDRKLLLPNRASCDRYLNKNEKNLLSNTFVCISIMLTDLKNKNKLYGRDVCDEMIKKFAENLTNIFPEGPNNMIAVNGLGQFVIFLDETTAEQAGAFMSYVSEEVIQFNQMAKCKMEYKYGIAETKREEIFKLKDLMICAINKASQSETEESVQEQNTHMQTDMSKKHDEKKEDKVDDLLERLKKIRME